MEKLLEEILAELRRHTKILSEMVHPEGQERESLAEMIRNLQNMMDSSPELKNPMMDMVLKQAKTMLKRHKE